MSAQQDSSQTQQNQTVMASIPNSMGSDTHQIISQQHAQQQQNLQTNLQTSVSSGVMTNMGSSASLLPVQHPQTSAAGLSHMQSLQGISQGQNPQQINAADWSHGRVQLIQQPLQNHHAYLPQLYHAQGQILMPGNISIHPGMNPQQIQVIAAGKPFPGGQIAPHMLTTAQGKQVLHTGQTSSYPGYSIPTLSTSQNQTIVLSPVNVITSQPNMPTHTQVNNSISGQSKPGEMDKSSMAGQKVQVQKIGAVDMNMGSTGQNGQQQCVQVSQAVLGGQPNTQIINPLQASGQAVQFAPWQLSGTIPQVWTGGLQTPQLLAPNQIFIRGTGQSDGTSQGMFIQQSPQTSAASTISAATHNSGLNFPFGVPAMQQSANPNVLKPCGSSDNLTPKGPHSLSNIAIPLNICPTNTMAASNVSTQTGVRQIQNQIISRQGKPRGRSVLLPATQKQDAANQTNKQPAKMLVMSPKGSMSISDSNTEKGQQSKKKAIQQQQVQQQQLQLQQSHANLIQQQQALLQQQMIHQQQIAATQNSQQNQNQLQSKNLLGMPHSMQQQSGMPLTAMAPTGTIIGQLASTVPGNTTSLNASQVLGQNTLHVQNATMVQSGQLIQTSTGLVETNPTANLSQQNNIAQSQLNQQQMLDQQLNQTSNSIQGILQSQNNLMQASGVMLSSQMQQLGSHQNMLHSHQNLGQPLQQVFTSTSGLQTLMGVAQPMLASPQSNLAASPTPHQHQIQSQPQYLQSSPQIEQAQQQHQNQLHQNMNIEQVQQSMQNQSVQPLEIINVQQQIQTNTPIHNDSSRLNQNLPNSTGMKSLMKMVAATQFDAPISTHNNSTGCTTISKAATTTKVTQTSLNITFPAKSSHMSMHPAAEKALPQAKVRPNVLTHVIEGFVIQEAEEPFAISKPSKNHPLVKQDKENGKLFGDEKKKKKKIIESNASTDQSSPVENEKTERFEDIKSIKKTEIVSNNGPRKPLTTKQSSLSSTSALDSRSSEAVSKSVKCEEVTSNVLEEIQVNSSDTNNQIQTTVLQWSVNEVCNFIKNIPGCAMYADDFAMQEVDGEALALIKPEHLVMAMSMKLGPALKIVASIDALRLNKTSDESENQTEDIKRGVSLENVSNSPKKVKYE